MTSSIKKIIQIALFVFVFNTSAHADVVTPISWTTGTVNDATATVTGNDIALRVYDASWASATAYLGGLNGSLTTSFDYTYSADTWQSDMALFYLTNDYPNAKSQNFSIPGCNFPLTGWSNCGSDRYGLGLLGYGGSITGSVSSTIPVSGPTYAIFAGTPSPFTSASDHQNTYLSVSNLAFSYIPNNSAPEMNPSLIPQVGFLLGCLFLMFGRKKENSDSQLSTLTI